MAWLDIAAALTVLLFALLAALLLLQWDEQRTSPAKWAALTFGVLALTAGTLTFLPDEATGTTVDILRRLALAALPLFPYLLFRFTDSLTGAPRYVRPLALPATLAVAAIALTLPDVSDLRSTESAWPRLYLAGLLVQWTALSLVVAVTLWRAGAGQPAMARRRMRTLSAATMGLSLALLLAGAASERSEAVVVAIRMLSVSSALLFFVAYSPPASLRTLWRRRAQQELQHATAELMVAATETEIADALLPHVVALVGAKGSALVATNGRIIGTHGVSPEDVPPVETLTPFTGRERTADAARPLAFRLPLGWLLVWVTPYTPFFGRDDLEVLRSLGYMATLALQRSDLLEREREARLALERERNFSERLVASSIDGILAFDRDFRYTVWNAGMERITGITKDKVVGRRAFDVFPFLEEIGEDRFFTEALKGNTVATGERPYTVRETGKRGFFTALYAPLYGDDGDVVGGFAIVRDVTEERELDAAKDRFIADAAHELRTPLTTLAGLAEVLAGSWESMPEDRRLDTLRTLRRQGERARRLIRDMLDLSRLESGKIEMDVHNVSVAAVTHHCLESVPPPEGTTVDVDVPDDLTAVADPDRLEQVLSNLLENAYGYGRPPVTVVGRREADEVVLEVRDCGGGVEADEIPSLFEPFTRGVAARSRQGSGLGLAISKRIAEGLGGTLEYRPNEPHGARFILRLRAAQQPAATPAR